MWLEGLLFSPAQPVRMHYWELLVHFEVHGSGKNLFGDGFAIWYTKERAETGEEEGARVWVEQGRESVCGGGEVECVWWVCGGGEVECVCGGEEKRYCAMMYVRGMMEGC